MLAGREAIGRSLAEAPPPATASSPAETPALPTFQACDVERPETCAQARSGPHHALQDWAMGKEMEGLRAMGICDE